MHPKVNPGYTYMFVSWSRVLDRCDYRVKIFGHQCRKICKSRNTRNVQHIYNTVNWPIVQDAKHTLTNDYSGTSLLETNWRETNQLMLLNDEACKIRHILTYYMFWLPPVGEIKLIKMYCVLMRFIGGAIPGRARSWPGWKIHRPGSALPIASLL